jgi:hypothetical protein
MVCGIDVDQRFKHRSLLKSSFLESHEDRPGRFTARFTLEEWQMVNSSIRELAVAVVLGLWALGAGLAGGAAAQQETAGPEGHDTKMGQNQGPGMMGQQSPRTMMPGAMGHGQGMMMGHGQGIMRGHGQGMMMPGTTGWDHGMMMGHGMMGHGQGMMMGHGMMGHGQGMMMGRGMMGHGQGMMMGHGMMGHGMSGMGTPHGTAMMPGRMMHHGMMHPGMMGQGAMGQPYRSHGTIAPRHGWPIPAPRDLTDDDVRQWLDKGLDWLGNARLKVGQVTETDGATITAEIVTLDDSLVQRLAVDRRSGAVRQVE